MEHKEQLKYFSHLKKVCEELENWFNEGNTDGSKSVKVSVYTFISSPTMTWERHPIFQDGVKIEWGQESPYYLFKVTYKKEKDTMCPLYIEDLIKNDRIYIKDFEDFEKSVKGILEDSNAQALFNNIKIRL